MKKQPFTTSQDRKLKFAEAGVLFVLVLALTIFLGVRVATRGGDDKITAEPIVLAEAAAPETVTNTAAALPPSHIIEIREKFPWATLYSMYGLTECKRVSYLPPSELATRPTSVGKGMPNEEVYLVGEDGSVIDDAAVFDGSEALAKGAFDFIAKPFKPDDLRQVISRAAAALKG